MTQQALAATWREAALQKRIDPADLVSTCQKLRSAGKRIATLNGSFDLLHAGHLEMIYAASQAADILIVACNTDASIQAYKSAERPIVPLEYRLSMLSALGFVDYVTWFDETDPRELLSLIQPDVHVNGAEYGKQCIEAETVERYGGRVEIVELVPGLSTSALITKIRGLCD